jgi:hypothetical protein
VNIINIEIHKQNRLKDFLHKIHYNIEETAFKLFDRIPEKYIPACLIKWMEHYTDKRLSELKQQIIRSNWQTIEFEKVVNNIHTKQQG